MVENYAIISDKNAEDIAIWFDEQFVNGEFAYIDPYINRAFYINVGHIRDAIFNMKLWGVILKDKENINSIFLINAPDPNRSHIKFANVIAYDSIDSNFFEYAIEKIKEEFPNEIKKLRFKIFSIEEDRKSSINNLPLIEELENKNGYGRKKIYSYFL